MDEDEDRRPEGEAGHRGLSDRELTRRIQAGDEDAFPILFDRYVRSLQRRAREWLPAKLRRKVSVADVLQEARITALRRFLDFEHRGEGSVRNWLLRIVELKVREAVRTHKGTAQRDVEREISRGYRPDTAHFPGFAATPSEIAAASELKELADRALASLPPHYREVLELARGDRLSLREIAVRTDRSREAVKKIHARALSQFTRTFERLRGGTHGS